MKIPRGILEAEQSQVKSRSCCLCILRQTFDRNGRRHRACPLCKSVTRMSSRKTSPGVFPSRRCILALAGPHRPGINSRTTVRSHGPTCIVVSACPCAHELHARYPAFLKEIQMKADEDRVTRPENTELAFYESAGRPTARYVSDTAVCEEALEHGRLVGLYWSACGQVQRENVTSALPGLDSLILPLNSFELQVDGQSLHNRWQWVKAFQQPGGRPGTVEAVVVLRHDVRPVTVRVVTRLDGSAVFARRLEITNKGSAPAALAGVCPWSGLLWNTPANANPSVDRTGKTKFTLGYLRGEDAGEEGNFVRQGLGPETFRIERTHGNSHCPPYFIVKNETTGELFFLALAYSGNHYAEFAERPIGRFGSQECLTFRLGPLGPAPLRVIAPGETVLSPEVHLAPLHCDLDAAVRKWHRHLRTSVIPTRPAGKEMYTLAGRVVEEPGDWILREVDVAAEMGLEAFMVDAGWYGEKFASWPEQRGDWFEGGWLPGGMAGVREYVHGKGMLFGLWMEAEAISGKSRLAREHPDWFLTTDDERRCSDTLDLANPRAAEYVEESVIRVIRDFELDFFKLDYNVKVGEGGQTIRDGYAEGESWRHYEAIYGLFDRVCREFPQVALENCASGGGRNDLGMMARFHYSCESDFSTHPLAIRAINAMTLFLPPESVCYYHNHISHAHLMADLDTHLRVTLFALPIFVGFGAQQADRSTSYFAKTRRYIELAKTFCRPVMAGRPRVFHHTPDIGLLEPAEWCVLEYAAEDCSRGYAGVFKLDGRAPDEFVFRPRGLDLSRDYEVTMDNTQATFRASGAEIANSGIFVRLEGALTSELLLFSQLE